VVEQIARGWMSVSGVINTHFIVAHMISHTAPRRRRRTTAEDGRGAIRGAFSMSEPDLGSDVAAIKTRASRTVGTRRGLRHRRRQDVADQRRQLDLIALLVRPMKAPRSRTRT